MKKEVVLLSGGADSTTLLYKVMSTVNTKNKEIYALSIMYGQRHKREIELAKQTVAKLKSNPLSPFIRLIDHQVVDFNFGIFGGSPLTDLNIDVPTQESGQQTKTVVPYRNTAFITLAAMYASSVGADTIHISAVYDDLLSYPDCRPEYYSALQKALRLGGTISNLRISVPYNEFKKYEVIAEGKAMRVDYGLTHTCYNGTSPACGECDACIERMLSFEIANVEDPLQYKTIIPYYESSMRKDAIRQGLLLQYSEYSFVV